MNACLVTSIYILNFTVLASECMPSNINLYIYSILISTHVPKKMMCFQMMGLLRYIDREFVARSESTIVLRSEFIKKMLVVYLKQCNCLVL